MHKVTGRCRLPTHASRQKCKIQLRPAEVQNPFEQVIYKLLLLARTVGRKMRLAPLGLAPLRHLTGTADVVPMPALLRAHRGAQPEQERCELPAPDDKLLHALDQLLHPWSPAVPPPPVPGSVPAEPSKPNKSMGQRSAHSWVIHA